MLSFFKKAVVLTVLFSAQMALAQSQEASGNGSEEPLLQAEMATVVTDQSRPEDCLAAVAINKIDGEARVVSAQRFSIEPGPHTLNGLAILDTTHCSITGDDRQINTAEDLEFTFEAGQTYYVGYYHKSDIPDERRLVVWKVEQTPFTEQPIQ